MFIIEGEELFKKEQAKEDERGGSMSKRKNKHCHRSKYTRHSKRRWHCGKVIIYLPQRIAEDIYKHACNRGYGLGLNSYSKARDVKNVFDYMKQVFNVEDYTQAATAYFKEHMARQDTPLAVMTPDQIRSLREWSVVRVELFNTQPNICVACGTTHNLQADHIKPLVLFPELGLDLDNLQLLCGTCNGSKGTQKDETFKRKRVRQLQYNEELDNEVEDILSNMYGIGRYDV